MRYAFAVICLLIAGAATASPAEDFKACLIGYSVMALDEGVRDPAEAQRLATGHCPLPDDPADEIDFDAIADHVHELVERMAAE